MFSAVPAWDRWPGDVPAEAVTTNPGLTRGRFPRSRPEALPATRPIPLSSPSGVSPKGATLGPGGALTVRPPHPRRLSVPYFVCGVAPACPGDLRRDPRWLGWAVDDWFFFGRISPPWRSALMWPCRPARPPWKPRSSSRSTHRGVRPVRDRAAWSSGAVVGGRRRRGGVPLRPWGPARP